MALKDLMLGKRFGQNNDQHFPYKRVKTRDGEIEKTKLMLEIEHLSTNSSSQSSLHSQEEGQDAFMNTLREFQNKY